MTLSITVNGSEHHLKDDMGSVKLLDFLHEDLNLTGTKFCCGIGECRGCTVAVRKEPGNVSEPVISCSTPLSLLKNAEVTTVEGVADGDKLHPVQKAFLEDFAFQCGYCTPGFVMASFIFLDWLAKAPVKEDELDLAIEDAIGMHICRCTGYIRYFQAVKSVALEILAGKEGARA